MGFSNVVLGNEYVAIDSTITAIMVRELLEGAVFCVTHIGAVVKNPVLTINEKKRSLRVLIPAIFSGVSIGLLISIFVGISLIYAVGDQTSTKYGIEVGEGVSRLIGALFVTDLALKLPKWFKISKSRPSEDQSDVRKDFLATRWEMGFSLWWNVLRESIEGGTLTAVAVILSKASEVALGNSVGLAIGIACILGLGFGLGGKYVNAKFFGLLAAFFAQVLAVGLWTGSARAFEEVYGLNTAGNEEAGSKMIYNYEDTPYGDSLTILEFLGFSYSLTALTLSVFIIAWVVLTGMQIWHNVLGYSFVPKFVHDFAKAAKTRLGKGK